MIFLKIAKTSDSPGKRIRAKSNAGLNCDVGVISLAMKVTIIATKFMANRK
jgi:hypothetical protein